MIEWFGIRGRRRPLDDFASAIRPELQEQPVPRATESLLQRIRASRGAGARVILPAGDPPRRRRLARSLSAVVAAAVVVYLLLQRPEPAPPDIRASASWFAGAAAFAQTPAGTEVAPARVTVAGRLRPMRIAYERVDRDSAGRETARLQIRVSVERAVVGGAAVWRVVSAQANAREPGWAHQDTVLVTADELRLVTARIHEAPYRRFSHIAVTQRVDGARIRGTMIAERDGNVAAERHFDRPLPADAAPYVADAFAPLFLMGVALDRDWQGRVAILGWAVRDDDVYVPIEMRVVGEETLRLSAGEFSCWRLQIRRGGRASDYWVRKSDGLGVQSLHSTGGRSRRDIRLVSVR